MQQEKWRLNQWRAILFILFYCWISTMAVIAQELDPATSISPDYAPAAKQMQTLWQQLNKKYVKLESYIDLLLLSLLSQKHVFSFGGPGGSKTAVASDLLGAMQEKTFSLQFSPATKEEVIRGIQNIEKLLQEAKIEFSAQQSLLMHVYAILDEIDKANPEVLASLLSILHERSAMLGDTKIAGKLQTALVTSNMSLFEFLGKFRATNDESTGKAILDRVAYKTWVSNRLPEAEDLYEIYCGGDNKEIELPTLINIQQLTQAVQEMVAPREVAKLAFQLWMKLLKVLERQQMLEGQAHLADPTAHPYPYTMTNQFSTRGAGVMLDVLKAAKALDEIKKNPLVDLSKLTWDVSDIRYGEATMVLQGPAGNSIEGGKDTLEDYEDVFEFDPRTFKMLQDLRFEREKFNEIYYEVLREYREELEEYIEIDLTSPPHIQLEAINFNEAHIRQRREDAKITKEREGRGIPEIAREKILEDLQQKRIIIQGATESLLEKQPQLDPILRGLKERKERMEEISDKAKELQKAKRVERKVSGTGSIFTRIEEEEITSKIGESWQDPSGLIWGDVPKAEDQLFYTSTLRGGQKYCENLGNGFRLPTRKEYEKLAEYLGLHASTGNYVEILPNFKPYRFWYDLRGEATPRTLFNTENGNFMLRYPLEIEKFRCVYAPTISS